MTGPTTYDEASGMPFPDVVSRYQALNDRNSMSRAIATLQARGEWNDDRSLNPADYPPLTAAEHLELIALGERLARHYRHPAQVHHAVVAGATWEQIAAAAGDDPDQARQAYAQWAEGQHRLRQDFPGGTIGLDDGEYAAAVKASGGGGREIAPDPADVLAAVRAVLAGFDWERGNRKYALEAIERILDGGRSRRRCAAVSRRGRWRRTCGGRSPAGRSAWACARRCGPGPGGRQALPGALDDQLALELIDRAQEVEHQAALRGGGVDLLLQDDQADIAVAQLIGQREQVLEGPHGAGQPGDDEDVAGGSRPGRCRVRGGRRACRRRCR